jgi:hypothetical protein
MLTMQPEFAVGRPKNRDAPEAPGVLHFYRLVDPNDIKRFGPVSPEPDNIRHAGPSGDIGDYRSDEVQGMAHSFASDAAKAK